MARMARGTSYRGQSILDDFIGNVSVTGFFHRGARNASAFVRGSFRAGLDHCVHLFLGKCGEFFLGSGGAGHQFSGFLNGDEVAVAQAQITLPSLQRLNRSWKK